MDKFGQEQFSRTSYGKK